MSQCHMDAWKLDSHWKGQCSESRWSTHPKLHTKTMIVQCTECDEFSRLAHIDLKWPVDQVHANLCCWPRYRAKWYTCPQATKSQSTPLAGCLPNKAINTSHLVRSSQQSPRDAQFDARTSSSSRSSSSLAPPEDQCNGAAGGKGGSSVTFLLLAPAPEHSTAGLLHSTDACPKLLLDGDATGARFSLSTARDDIFPRFCLHFVWTCTARTLFGDEIFLSVA